MSRSLLNNPPPNDGKPSPRLARKPPLPNGVSFPLLRKKKTKPKDKKVNPTPLEVKYRPIRRDKVLPKLKVVEDYKTVPQSESASTAGPSVSPRVSGASTVFPEFVHGDFKFDRSNTVEMADLASSYECPLVSAIVLDTSSSSEKKVNAPQDVFGSIVESSFSAHSRQPTKSHSKVSRRSQKSVAYKQRKNAARSLARRKRREKKRLSSKTSSAAQPIPDDDSLILMAMAQDLPVTADQQADCKLLASVEAREYEPPKVPSLVNVDIKYTDTSLTPDQKSEQIVEVEDVEEKGSQPDGTSESSSSVASLHPIVGRQKRTATPPPIIPRSTPSGITYFDTLTCPLGDQFTFEDTADNETNRKQIRTYHRETALARTEFENCGFSLKEDQFLFYNLWDLRILRENSVVDEHDNIVVSYRGLSRAFKWNDIIGTSSRYELDSIVGTEFAIYSPREGISYRYLDCGLTPKEKGQLFSTLSYRRDDKKPMDNPTLYRIISSVVKSPIWEPVIHARASVSLVDAYTKQLKLYDYNRSITLHEHARSCFKQVNPWLYRVPMLLVMFYFFFPFFWGKDVHRDMEHRFLNRFHFFLKWFVLAMTEYFHHSRMFVLCGLLLFVALIFVYVKALRKDDPKLYRIVASFSKLGGRLEDAVVKRGSKLLFADAKKYSQHTIKALGAYIPTCISFPTNTAQNMMCSIVKRQMRHVSHIDDQVMTEFLEYVEDDAEETIPPCIDLVPTLSKWLDDRAWSTIKKEYYDNVFDGFCAWSSKRSSFMKREIVLSAPSKPARLINASEPEIQCAAGPYMTAIKKYFVKYSLDQPVTMVCGMSRNEVGSLLSRRLGVLATDDVAYVAADFSKFDSTVGARLMEIERSVYKQIFPDSMAQSVIEPFIARCQQDFKTYGHNKNFNTGAYVPASRGSGDPNTTIGNTIINYYMWKYMLQRFNPAGVPIFIFVCGDDVLVFGRRDHVDNFIRNVRASKFFAGVGTKLEFEPTVDHYSKTTFLSGWYVDGAVLGNEDGPYLYGAIVHAAKIGRVLSKTMLTYRMWHNPEEFAILRNSKLLAIANELWYLPKFRLKILTFLRTYDGKLKSDKHYRYEDNKVPAVTDATRSCFKLRYWYDLNTVDEHLTEKFKIGEACELVSPIFRHLLAVDCDAKISNRAEEDDMIINDSAPHMTTIEEMLDTALTTPKDVVVNVRAIQRSRNNRA